MILSMLNGLKVINLKHSLTEPKCFAPSLVSEREAEVHSDILKRLEQHSFTLRTCQRLVFVGLQNQVFQDATSIFSGTRDYDYFEDREAYHFLLETICGLKSQLLGESEIVAQFKEAYTQYIDNGLKNPYIMATLEKLLKDSKEIRSHYLKEIGQYSYSGLSKKLLSKHLKSQTKSEKKSPVVLYGSGQLAHDLIKVLNKKYELILCARNQQKVEQLSSQYNLEYIPWDKKKELIDFSAKINTIGAKNILLFDEIYLRNWYQKHDQGRVFIDLGSPSVLDSTVKFEGLYRLSDIFKASGQLNQQKQEKVAMAKSAIDDLSLRRMHTSALNFPFGWEDLQFAH